MIMDREIELYIETNQIKLDVDTETRKASLMHVPEDKPLERIEASMGEEFSDLAYFTRQCKSAMDGVVAMLHDYVKTYTFMRDDSGEEEGEDTHAGMNTLIYEDEVVIKMFSLSLLMPQRSSVMPGVLAGTIHRYMVYYILHMWAIMTMPAMAATYMEHRDSAAREILTMITRSAMPTKTRRAEVCGVEDNVDVEYMC